MSTRTFDTGTEDIRTEIVDGVMTITLNRPDRRNAMSDAMLTGLDRWKFRHPARPGDQLRLETNLLRYRQNFGRAAARATIGDALCAEGEISFALVDRPPGL